MEGKVCRVDQGFENNFLFFEESLSSSLGVLKNKRLVLTSSTEMTVSKVPYP